MDQQEQKRIAGAAIIERYMHRAVASETDPDLIALREYFAIIARVAARSNASAQQQTDSRETQSRATIYDITNNTNT